jgi:hypothetical protein
MRAVLKYGIFLATIDIQDDIPSVIEIPMQGPIDWSAASTYPPSEVSVTVLYFQYRRRLAADVVEYECIGN